MSAKFVEFTAAASGHWLKGSLALSMERIQETLNDGNTQFLQLADVEVRPANGQTRVHSRPKMVALKSTIDFIIINAARHEAPTKRMDNFIVKPVFHSFAVISGYCIWGDLQLSDLLSDTRLTLLHQLGNFFPLTNASIVDAHVEQSGIPLIFINRNRLSCFDVGEAAGKPVSTSTDASADALSPIVAAALGELGLPINQNQLS